ncbi:MAG TPA: 2'-5' RNA ligase family protein [Chitinophagaceae bacterium]|jgi:2'-5' RNA ligase
MQLTGTSMPGYRVYEYLLVLDPHEELRQKITDVRENFKKTFHNTVTMSRPHITLVNFLQYEMMEERLLNRLRTVAMGFLPVKIELKDFGSYPSHTIYINVTSKVPIQALVKNIRMEAQRLMQLNEDNKPHFIMEPNVPVARRLVPWQYEKGWLEFSEKHFSGRFIADGMLLIKRRLDDIGYQVVEKFAFQNLPVTTRQGQLFG